jgi:hypothetical protein
MNCRSQRVPDAIATAIKSSTRALLYVLKKMKKAFGHNSGSMPDNPSILRVVRHPK